MPTLNWIGKDAVINHHLEVPFRLLKDVPELACGDPGSGNLIVEGDNLAVLKALLPYYKGKVKCICIDPPYNTGNEGWVYNDNVNSPAIRKWIGDTVGGEGETLDRHDRWLCMMYPRLALLREFLSEEGSIWICLDDNEIHALRYIMDEIFGTRNFVGTICWQKKQSPSADAINLSPMHDYILVYAKKTKESRDDPTGWNRNLIPRGEVQDARFTNQDNDPRGSWTSTDYTCNKTANERRNLYYPIINPNTDQEIWPSKTRVWAYERSAHEVNVLEKRIWWGADGKGKPRIKKYSSEVIEGVVPSTWWDRIAGGDNQLSRRELRELMHDAVVDFSTPKPAMLFERILQIATNPGDLVLDSFAGSGTTGHAVLKMNAANKTQDASSTLGKRQDASSTVEAASRRFPTSAQPHYFSPEEPVACLSGNLPHWRQDGVTYFVTFRTADSMPQEKLALWVKEREAWMANHPEPHDAETKREYYKLFPERLQDWLDQGYGACLLARPEIKAVVQDALRHFDGERYQLGEFVVMPNHVHALVTPLGEENLSDLLHSWKSFTSKKFHKLLGGTGTFWQKESFDHIVRSPEQMERITQYIKDNPKKVEAASRRFLENESSRHFEGEGELPGLGADGERKRLEASLTVGKTQDASSTLGKRQDASSTIGRRFILVEMEPKIAQDITRERVKRVAEGYKNAKGEKVEGLGGGFRYVRLGEELFDEHGRINESKVRFADLARHVYFSETGEPLVERMKLKKASPLLGIHHGRAVYLLYNGILKDKSVDGGNILTTATLAHLPAHEGAKVVYAAGCRFSKARLERESISFKQTPYAIRTK